MDETTQTKVLEYIIDEWKTVRGRPGRVWIRLYDPVPVGAHFIDSKTLLPRIAWLLDEIGLEQRSIWEYQRFYVCQFEQPWSLSAFKRPYQVPQSERIAVAAFAYFKESVDILVDMMWYGLMGRGDVLRMNTQGELRLERNIWIA